MKAKNLMAGAVCMAVLLSALAGAAVASSAPCGRANGLLDAEGALCAESALGCVAADALRRASGADIAIVCGGDISGSIPAGEVSRDAAEHSLDSEKDTAVAVVSARELREILENGVSHITLDLSRGDVIDARASEFDAFPQVSGMTFTYDASALPGSRIVAIKVGAEALDMEDGSPRFALAAAGELLAGRYGGPALETARPQSLTLADTFCALLECSPEGVDKPTARMKVIGTSDIRLVDSVIPTRSIGVLLLVFVLCFGVVKSGIIQRDKDEFE